MKIPTTRLALALGLLIPTSGMATVAAAEGPSGRATEAPRTIEKISAPFDMPPLVRPRFPNRVFDIRDFGAVGGGATLNSTAIAKAISACADAGGGRVLVPDGTWLTGAVHLQSNVELHLAPGAVLRFSADPQDYLPVVFTRWAGFECMNYSPLIYARGCENIAITGTGKIQGRGEKWWPWKKLQAETAGRMYRDQVLKGVPPEQRIYGTPEAGLRPQLISPIDCRNVLLEGFTIDGPGPFWTIQCIYCQNVLVRDLDVHTFDGPNADGVNIDSSRNVLVEYCRFDTGDDCVCLKSGINEDGWRVNRPTENVVVRNIRSQRGHGGVVIGSETSGGIRNVHVTSCHFDGTDIGIRMKSTRGRGGVVENISYHDITMGRIGSEAIRINTSYKAWFGFDEGKPPLFRNIIMDGIRCREAEIAAEIVGLPESPIEEMVLRNIEISANKGMTVSNVKGLAMENMRLDMGSRAEHPRPVSASGR